MIEAARKRGLYDQLAVDEAQRFLDRTDARWDAIAAVDTLNYLGALTPIFAAAARHTDFFLGTVERADDDDAMVLRATRRYAHGRAALERAVAESGWRLTACENATLRTEAGVGVAGFVFSLER
jgi:predicted TPR repeat methyltransferase